ncbi:DUF4145 domain-containing protein [Lujinxingia vulgaris]|uniref:DUF4145 domain-containing protein n=1 Tax=Lujinxingia vulgaris TaxID=2600176 RepID=A0A5C6XAS6_9DELT|nr:DUF4145 domain-containing protein [Lujinxingia vulgaris]TXD34247.1 DUF4145 domain-containing protein [Lujinxingia vulgaris]
MTNLSVPMRCPHCNNNSPSLILSTYWDIATTHAPGMAGHEWQIGECYEFAECISCGERFFYMYHWHEHMEPEEAVPKVLFPSEKSVPEGVPEHIKNSLLAANKVRNIDYNAYATLLGRTLELICVDQSASGKDLYEKINDLVNRDLIPKTLADIAHNVRILRNYGAHATKGEISEQEVPVLDSLIHSLCEYLYVFPSLLNDAQKALNRCKSNQKKQNT